jgi:hypothetical protein
VKSEKLQLLNCHDFQVGKEEMKDQIELPRLSSRGEGAQM